MPEKKITATDARQAHSAASRYGAGAVRLAVPMFDGRTRTRSWLVQSPIAASAIRICGP
jgi:hypothetical protein